MEVKWSASLQDKVSGKLDNIANKVGNVDDKFNSLNNGLKGLAGGIGLGMLAGAAKNFGMSVVDSLRNYEKFSAGLRVLMGGDKGAAEALNNQLVQLAKTTPFELTDVQEGSRQLLAYGFSAGAVTKNLKMLGDVSSAVGAPLNDIVYLYGTLKTQGRAYQKDINQFTGRGIPIIKELAKQFGVTEGAVQDLVKAGKVGFKEIEQAFKGMTSEGGQFFGMMDEQSKTIDGKISNMGDAWEQLKVNMGKSQTGIISATVDWANSMLSEIGKVIERSNQMDEAFAAKKLQGPSIWETIGGTLGNTDLRGQRNLVKEVSKMYDFATGQNTPLALHSQMQLMYAGKVKESKNFAAGGGVDKENYEKRMAIWDYFINKTKSALDLLSKQPGKTEKTGASGKSEESTGLPTEYRGEKPQAINININEVNGIRTAEIYDSKQTTPAAKEALSNALLEVIDDINKIVRNR